MQSNGPAPWIWVELVLKLRCRPVQHTSSQTKSQRAAAPGRPRHHPKERAAGIQADAVAS